MVCSETILMDVVEIASHIKRRKHDISVKTYVGQCLENRLVGRKDDTERVEKPEVVSREERL